MSVSTIRSLMYPGGMTELAPRAKVAEAASAGPTEELVSGLGELFIHLRAHFERTAQQLDLPPACAKALRMIDGSMSMKELGSRIHCDGSFVTSIADTLEQRGLVRREIDPGDRRIKNLVLTRRGAQLRDRIARELFADVPGVRNLDAGEREVLLVMLRRMLGPEAGDLSTAEAAGCSS